jgi:hypothetical protein
MATLAQKIQCESRVREMLENQGMPPPDEVEYGYGCIRLFFNEQKIVLVVDIDDDTEVEDAIARRQEVDIPELDDRATDDRGPHDEGEGSIDEDRGPPFMTFPLPSPAQRN